MDVLIVGAGIAGPTLAHWLLRSGHHVALVERAPRLRSGGYLIDFWGAGFDVAERMGIVPRLRREGYVMNEARVVDERGRRIASIDPSAVLEADDHYVSIARSDLAAAIYDALGGEAELVLDDTVSAIDDAGGRVRVDFEHGGRREFDLVVGADGLHSRVRRLVFGPDEDFERYLGIVVAVFELPGYRPRDELVAMMHAEPGFQAVRVSLRDDVTMAILTVRHDSGGPFGDRLAQEQLLRERLGGAGWEVPAMLDAMAGATTFYFDAVSQIEMPSWTKGRVALVGDAGAAPSLLAGQGSALAMVESYVLAAELSRTGGDLATAFGRYQETLAPFLASKQAAARRLGVAFAPKDRFQVMFRNAVMRLMALPGVTGLAMGRSFHDAVTLPGFGSARG